MEIEFRIQNQTLKRVGDNRPANLSQEFLQLSFDFLTHDWDGLTRFALFSYQGTKYRIPLTDDACIVPNAVLQGDRFSFSVYGVNNDSVRATTNRIVIYLSDSGYTTNVENDIPDDDPTIVEQIYIDINQAKTDAETYAKEYADTGLSGKSDVGHTHTKSQITDFSHTHDDRYYTKDEFNAIINSIQNNINVNGDKQIIQTSETIELYGYLKENGMPQLNKKIHFYEKEES